jgi:ferredoxin
MQNKDRKIAKVIVDKDLCIGAGPCVIVAPEAFNLNNQGKAEVKKTAFSHTDDELIIAAQSCPVMAIKLLDKKGKQIFP